MYILFQFNLDTVWTVIFGGVEAKPVIVKGRNHKMELCSEAAAVLLAMVRTLLNQVCGDVRLLYSQLFGVKQYRCIIFI